MSVETTNIIGIVETRFTETVRRLLMSKNGSFELCNWAFACIDNKSHTDDIKDLVALLINEHYALHKQLTQKHNNA